MKSYHPKCHYIIMSEVGEIGRTIVDRVYVTNEAAQHIIIERECLTLRLNSSLWSDTERRILEVLRELSHEEVKMKFEKLEEE